MYFSTKLMKNHFHRIESQLIPYRNGNVKIVMENRVNLFLGKDSWPIVG